MFVIYLFQFTHHIAKGEAGEFGPLQLDRVKDWILVVDYLN